MEAVKAFHPEMPLEIVTFECKLSVMASCILVFSTTGMLWGSDQVLRCLT